ncbi:MAG: P-loop NTPase [bacterium]|nr:P-loop NTPase [bacterium]
MKKVKEIVVISGKGGTGKTTVTAALADIMPDKIMVDADVDASNLYLLMNPENVQGTDFIGKAAARINSELCTGCNRCKELCRFHAVDRVDGIYRVDDFSCDGCGLCSIACPAGAVEMVPQVVGQWFTAQTEFGDFIYARLIPGAENSGSLVAMVKKQAKEMAAQNNIDTLLIDGPPGIGCPVISAISGAHRAIIVTEPTYAGISDLERVFQLAKHLRVPCAVVVNRFDINRENTKKIETFASEKGIPVLALIPHSSCIMAEITRGNLPSRNCGSLAEQAKKIHNYILKT